MTTASRATQGSSSSIYPHFITMETHHLHSNNHRQRIVSYSFITFQRLWYFDKTNRSHQENTGRRNHRDTAGRFDPPFKANLSSVFNSLPTWRMTWAVQTFFNTKCSSQLFTFKYAFQHKQNRFGRDKTKRFKTLGWTLIFTYPWTYQLKTI